MYAISFTSMFDRGGVWGEVQFESCPNASHETGNYDAVDHSPDDHMDGGSSTGDKYPNISQRSKSDK